MPRILLAFTLMAPLVASSPALLDELRGFLSPLWSESSPDVGCGWDPWGGCIPPPAPDEGCGMDPWGCPKGS
jgi:hypothetical protein